MAEVRTYAFELGASVAVRASKTVGKIIGRDAEPDHPVTIEVSTRNAGKFEGRRLGDHVIVAIPVNAYQVQFTGDNGRPDVAWWHEDMLEAAA